VSTHRAPKAARSKPVRGPRPATRSPSSALTADPAAGDGGAGEALPDGGVEGELAVGEAVLPPDEVGAVIVSAGTDGSVVVAGVDAQPVTSTATVINPMTVRTPVARMARSSQVGEARAGGDLSSCRRGTRVGLGQDGVMDSKSVAGSPSSAAGAVGTLCLTLLLITGLFGCGADAPTVTTPTPSVSDVTSVTLVRAQGEQTVRAQVLNPTEAALSYTVEVAIASREGTRVSSTTVQVANVPPGKQASGVSDPLSPRAPAGAQLIVTGISTTAP
jgi:hypothetical protein